MDKSKKIVSLFLSSALVIGLSGCNDQPQYTTVYDQNGNPIQVIEEDDDDFDGGFLYWVSRPFRSKAYVPSTGISSGTSGSAVRPDNSTPSSATSQKGIVGRSPWASSSSSSSSSSRSSGSSGITSGAKGGIGSSGSSVS